MATGPLSPYALTILPKHLYQGPRHCLDWAESYDLVVSAAKEIKAPPGGIHLRLDDVRTDWRNWPEFQEAVLDVADEVAREVEDGGKVLVVCNMGWNRSGLVVGMALRLLGMPADEVVEYVREKRSPNALSNSTFADMVEHLDIRG
jgi:protein-tyrosine phosphatase